MSKLMTIQDFAERTGISKSALRYYESQNLLRSVSRDISGYRVYSEDQVEVAKLISSLRLADIPIKNIQAYLEESDEITRQKMMDNWIQMIKGRLDILNVSLRYLESENTSKNIYLLEKSAEKIIWFFAESEIGEFREIVNKKAKELEQLNIQIKNCYLKYISGKDVIKVQFGFGIPLDIHPNKLIETDFLEHMPACIYIAMSFNDSITKIQDGYCKLINYANENNWVPTGSILEWYRGNDFTNLDLLLPVTQFGKRGETKNV
ncbi:MerR family transcriptional regulator [Lysinibacillus sp. NPDC059133]|uniref:helix-turn-helix domain-containing protein n=1 Tax=Lysinibacillus sp. NPDC059133 TaxID=3346737 RepID=UPI003684C7DC